MTATTPMTHALRRRLLAGETVAVCNTDFPTPRLVEFVGTLGFDAVFIDCEHAATDFTAVEELARAARAAGMASILRPWSNETGLINRYLSCGVDGIQTPHVETRAEVEAIADGIAQWEGDHTGKLLVAMIESETAVANLPQMLDAEAVDVFYVGAFDLAQSMGLKGRPDHPAVRRAVETAIGAVARAGRAAGLNVQGDLDAVAHYRRLGLRWINVHLKALVGSPARGFLDSVRGPLAPA
ncbi:aldolase/citrate lyase family protein [Pseudochelatococcus sp. B33]